MRRLPFESMKRLAPVLFLAVGCGSDSGTLPDPVATTSVSVQDSRFSPVQNRVDPGAVVTWSWAGTLLHDITWVSADLPDASLRSTGTHQVTMPLTPGSYSYYCTQHGSPNSGMRGTVIVE